MRRRRCTRVPASPPSSRASEAAPAGGGELSPGSDTPFTDRAPVKQNTNMTESAVPEAGAAAAAAAAAEGLIFEQPLNERMRTFLRLDFLYNQALYHTEMASPWASRAAISTPIDRLASTTRGD